MKCTVCGCDNRMLCLRCREGRCARCETTTRCGTSGARLSKLPWVKKSA